MKNIISKKFIVFLAALLILSGSCSFPVSAKSKVRVKAGSVFVDKGESIVTGVDYDENYINSITVTSSDPTVATGSFDKENGTLTIQGFKKGKATISFDGYHKVGDTTAIVDYEVNVIDAFDTVTFSYYYSSITVNYDLNAIPEGCTPVFSIDGKDWTESNTLSRGVNDTVIYKAYKVDGVVCGSVKRLSFDNKLNKTTDTKEKEITMGVGDTCSIKDDIELTYDYYLINGRNNITFDEDNLSFTATDTGNTTLTIISSSTPTFSKDGSISSKTVEYNFKIKVKESSEEASEDGTDDAGEEEGSSEDQSSESSSGASSADSSENSSETSSGNNTDSSSETGSESSSGSSGSGHTPNPAPSITNTKGSWKNNSEGWWFEKEDGTYPVWDWLYIDDNWYFFDRNGYMDSNGYRFGCWLRPDGSWDYDYSNGKWKSDSSGWWYEDNGWYPTDQWLKIDGYWYYFKADGYMACNEWVGNYYLCSDGSMATDTWIGSYWVGSDGACR